jgi:acyl transferase domain-containing protein/acyl carrier protein
VEGTWLVSGGLGKLGRLVVERLAELGAGALALLSRRQPDDEELAWLAGLREKGVVGLWTADLTDLQELEGALEQIRSHQGPLRGVVHCAGLLDDGVLTEQTWERFLPVLAPKLEGAWNLHLTTRQDPLEAFFLFSSVAATLGSAGQANYSAANAFLEALAEARQAEGLPALAIGWGPWTVGMGAGLRPEHRERLERQGLGFLPPQEGLGLFQSLLGRGGRVLALRVDFEALRPWVGRELRPLLAELLPHSGDEPEPSPSILEPETLVRLHASRILGLPPADLDPRRPLRDYGLDSLMALELRKALSEALERNLPATLAFDQPTLEEQAAFLKGLVAPPSASAGHLPDSNRVRPPSPRPIQDEPIAVIGIGCHYPGGAEGPEAFWELLVSGRDAITEVPPERWDAWALYDPDPQVPGRMVTRWGGFLPDVDRFDASFFGIPPREARVMDPQQRLLLQTAWEALEDACLPPESLQGTPTGVFVGLSTLDYYTMLRDADQMDPWASTGVAPSVAAGRLAYQLGLKGPALALDTACSSSLLAVHLACQALRQGECDLALAGGANLILSPDTSCVMSAMGALSPSGRSRVFDAAADGYVRSDGCALVVLKPLSKALRDGDRILALVRGSAVNQDGRSNGLTAPHGPSQEAVIRRALERAGVEPWQVDYVEAHGVGTPLSDPLELQALAAALGPGRPPGKPLLVGSVKSQIGHAESAAGVAGLIKTVLALRHRVLPANLHFHTPNPLVPWAELPLRVVDRLLPWPPGPEPRLAGVSAFGISGTNVHVVLEEAPAPPPVPRLDRPWHLLPLSARSPEALRRQARNFARALEYDPDLGALCHAAGCGRSHLAHRLALVCNDPSQAARDLRVWADSGEVPVRMRLGQAQGTPRVALLFSGQGSQHVGMGRELYQTQPVFRSALERCAERLDARLSHPLLETMFENPRGLLDQTLGTQSALFSFEWSLWELWRDWGLQPVALLGHSVGEFVAACAAGVFTLEEALDLVATRGQLMQTLPPGSMAGVWASEKQVREALNRLPQARGVGVAAINSPLNVVVSGPSEGVDALCAHFLARGVQVTRLPISGAFHSPAMEPLLEEFGRHLTGVPGRPPRRPLYSSLNGARVDREVCEPSWWVRHMHEPVRFAAGLKALAGEGVDAFLEIGPQPVLLGMGAVNLLGSSHLWLPSIRPGEPEWRTILESLATLYVHGAEVDWKAFDLPYHLPTTSAPTYPWEAERHWFEAPQPPEAGHFLLSTWKEAQPQPPCGPEGWQVMDDGTGLAGALEDALRARGHQIGPGLQNLVMLWTGEPSDELDLPGQVQSHCRHLLETIQARGRQRLWILTRGACSTGDEGIRLDLAPLWGMARVIRLEHPELRCTRVDLPLQPLPEEAERLAEALLTAGGEDELALRDRALLAGRLQAPPHPPGAVWPTFQAEASYLITGGTGGLGLALARWMVRQGARELVLVSRRGLSNPVQAQAIRELEKRGARIRVEALDVGDRPALERLLGEIRTRGPLRGVFHAAGVADVGLMVDQDPERLARVLRPKVAGGWNLHELTLSDPLDWFVLYSSVGSILSSPGQSTYAAANAFLDGLATFRRESGLPVTCVNWTAFEDGGMSLGENLERFQQTGMGTLKAEEGTRILGRLMAAGTPASLVGALDLPRWLDYYPQWQGTSLLADLAAARPAPVRGRLRERLERLDPAALQEELRAEVLTRTARCLGLQGSGSLDPRASFQDQGLDSLMAVELRNGLGKDLDLDLPVTLVFDHPTPESLALHLSRSLLPGPAEPSSSTSPPAIRRESSPEAAPTGPVPALGEGSRVIPPRGSCESPEAIAVIGLGCRFPGGGHGPEAFWELLAEGRDAITTVPPERWEARAWYSPEPGTPGRMISPCGGFLPGPDLFDAEFFGIPPREAQAMDPQQRVLLETAWEALEHAGIAPSRLEGSATGVFIGVCSHDYETLLGGLEELDAWAGTGLQASVTAGRLSYLLGLRGPSLVLDTACSSSLVAIHLAALSLNSGECDLALAGGVNLVLSPAGSVVHSQTHSMAPDGRCKAFDQAADGFVRSDGCGVVVLKRLSAARRDGDRILALIRGSATNQDGRSNGLTAPHGPAQEAVIRQALDRAGIPASRVGFVEAHGTGTALGDPIELRALGRVIGRERSERGLWVGAVKSNLGHPEGAAGVAGLSKAVLALRHRAIPPNLHLVRPTPHVDWEGLHLQVPTSLETWAEEFPRVAGVSAFGISGTNAHVVLEEAPEETFPADPRLCHLLPLSARTPEALQELLTLYARHLRAHPEVPLGAICRTAAVGRDHFAWRVALVADSPAEMLGKLESLASSPIPSPIRETSVPSLGFTPTDEAGAWERTWSQPPEGLDREALEELAGLYRAGATVDWAGLHRPFPGPRVDLPTYPFQRRSFWIRRALEATIPTSPGKDRFFEVVWRPLPSPPSQNLEGCWAVLGSNPAEVAETLRKAGARVLYADSARLSGDWLHQHDLRGVVLLAGESAPGPVPPDSEPCRQALALIQALARHPWPTQPPGLWLVTRGACPLPGEAPDLAQAPLWGLGRSTMLEHPELDCRLVDLEPGSSPATLLAELSARDSENQVAWRGERRLAARLVRSEVAAYPARLCPDATYLLTGGLGALGLAVARRFVERGARHLVLVGRHAPSPSALETLVEMRNHGAEVRIMQTDVADAAQIEALFATVADSMPALKGLVHAAGVLDDGVLSELTPERLERVLAPKLQGAWNLHQNSLSLDLDFFVLFSSVAGVLGSAGQGNYAAANSGLDALALLRRAQGLPALSLDWGPWQAGMGAALNATYRQRLIQEGLGILEIEEGLAALEELLGAQGQRVVMPVDWEALRSRSQGPISPLVRELVPWRRPEEGLAPLQAEIEARDIESLQEMVRCHAARALGLPPEELNWDRPLRENGLDSLMALELRNSLARATRRNLPATLAFDHPTLREMAAFLAGPGVAAPARAPSQSRPLRLTEPDDRIALIGVGCRFPGGIEGPESFWQALLEGRDAITEVPPDRWDVEAFYDPTPGRPGKTSSRWGGFLTGIDLFDAAFFGIPPFQAERMDPQQRLLLEVSWEALERAGLPPEGLAGSQTGVFVGLTEQEYGQLYLRHGQDLDAWSIGGNSAAMASGRLSLQFGLQGPSMTVDTACSSSLLAVHLAMASLRSGESDLALAGGVTLMLTPAVNLAASQSRLLASDGRSKSFDALADGLVWSEGCGMVVLKRLAEARRDRNPILAVLRGSATNQDGRAGGLNGPALEAVVRRALQQARVEPGQVGMVEAFGLGLPLGDAIEARALGAVLAEGRTPGTSAWVGSVKSNFGHTMAASGVAGLIKAALAVHHGLIPASLHCARPTPHVEWESLPLRVATRPQPWPEFPEERVAGVSAFGDSGTNVHVVLSQAPPEDEPEASGEQGTEHLLLVSARTPETLREMAARLADHLQAHPSLHLTDVAWTLAVGRTHFAERLALSGSDPVKISRTLRAFAEGGEAPEPVSSTEACELARAWLRGGRLDPHAPGHPRPARRVDLPPHPFQRKRFWMEG